jgi:hypothetical protein
LDAANIAPNGEPSSPKYASRLTLPSGATVAVNDLARNSTIHHPAVCPFREKRQPTVVILL